VDLGLEQAVVVVTGGSKGIGFACARAFLDEGAKVAIVSRSEQNLAAAAAQLAAPPERLVSVAADLVDPDAATHMAAEVEKRLGPPDVLVNSAGAAQRYAPEKLGPSAYREAMDAKYFTYVHAISAVLQGMALRGRGSIVNIVGMGGKAATPLHIAGGSANAALMLTTVGLAAAYASRGVRVNAVNPGLTQTSRVEQLLRVEAQATGRSEEELLEQARSRIPLGRLADPAEIAAVTVFLASSRASYVTGAIVPMDGAANPVI
jgi:NAD(P)-dependent dehydrogenase (short-subunit alcohol dehydrogenase family)